MSLSKGDFKDFIHAIYGYEPFPWQTALLDRIIERGWPEGIDLPTASGKTACLDIAVFLLALGVKDGKIAPDNPARRRIFFVVDRRLIVDQAYQRGIKIEKALKSAEKGVVREVADKLKEITGGINPIVVSKLRGGTIKDNAWRTNPVQPAIITSTVDQIGSRMLFRSYGAGPLSSPIEASLCACDSIILLDEAHCAVPFMQTSRLIRIYSEKEWMEQAEPMAPPASLSILSATLPEEVEDIFPDMGLRRSVLDHTVLNQRIKKSKPAELMIAKKPGKRDWSLGSKTTKDELALDCAQKAANLSKSGEFHRIAVIVNRVAGAAEIHGQLKSAVKNRKLDADIALMTGRMRPADRDALIEKWDELLRAGSEQQAKKPVILVSTQCLEVGADYSFDALITECASLDALRQRFGRLNRLGNFEQTRAYVIIRKKDVKPENKLNEDKPLDPIYGNSAARTWNWLQSHAEDSHFDFGIEAVESKMEIDPGQNLKLVAPSPEAPVLLPAHLDMLCQTWPRPEPDPDISLFLHGPQRGAPEAGIVFRGDLCSPGSKQWKAKWLDTVSLLPPVTAESLSVPLYVLKKWLSGQIESETFNELSDVESQSIEADDEDVAQDIPFVIWRGANKSEVSRNVNIIRPNEIIVVRADEKTAELLGPAFNRIDDKSLDIAERAYLKAYDFKVMRLVDDVLGKWDSFPPVKDLLDWAKDEEREEKDKLELLHKIAEANTDNEEYDEHIELPNWLRETAHYFYENLPRISPHPENGLILLQKKKIAIDLEIDPDLVDAFDSSLTYEGAVFLSSHLQRVGKTVEDWAVRCLPEKTAEALTTAAKYHDLGKADERFQIFLNGDEMDAAKAIDNNQFIAKSAGTRRSLSLQRWIRNMSGLPNHFRHELLSMQLIENANSIAYRDNEFLDLILHLTSSHHGYGRPFAPLVEDKEFPDVNILVEGKSFSLNHSERKEKIPPCRVDSGIAERFWRLNRRYGWWGLAYLEAIIRLADQLSSRIEYELLTVPKRGAEDD